MQRELIKNINTINRSINELCSSINRNRDEIKRVPEEEGVQALVDLIKEDGKWVDP